MVKSAVMVSKLVVMLWGWYHSQWYYCGVGNTSAVFTTVTVVTLSIVVINYLLR